MKRKAASFMQVRKFNSAYEKIFIAIKNNSQSTTIVIYNANLKNTSFSSSYLLSWSVGFLRSRLKNSSNKGSNV
jgi:hypothetical protein